MKNIIKYIKNNIFLSVSISLLIVVLIIMIISYLPNKSIKGNNSDKLNIEEQEMDVFDKISEMLNKSENTEIKSAQGESAMYYSNKKILCPKMEYSILSNDEIFITYENNIYNVYKYDMNLKFSNELNCIFINSIDKKPIGLAEYTNLYVNGKPKFGNYIIYEDLYYAEVYNNTINNHNSKDSISVHKNITDYNPDFLIGIYQSHFNERFMIYKHNIYNMYVHYYDNHFELISSIPEDERVIKVNGLTLVTNKAIYNYGIVDYSCYEYADKECKNGFKKNVDLTKRYDDIMFVNDSYVIFRNGNTYFYEVEQDI